MSGKPRYELKYRLTSPAYHRVRADLTRHTCLDPYSRKASRGRYFVRSLYYDTSDYRAYAEKMTGESSRIKLRLRSYVRTRDEATIVSVELKTRSGRLITKFSTHISVERCDQFLESGSWDDDENAILVEFERLTRLRHLGPKTLVDYSREALLPLDRSDVRITFDHAIRFSRATELFPSNASFRQSLPVRVVLEIKTEGSLPVWMHRIIKRHDLMSEPNSKYTQSIEMTQHSLLAARGKSL